MYNTNLRLTCNELISDFMSMAVIGDMLRSSGAFYIRRSFMDNALYWAVFQVDITRPCVFIFMFIHLFVNIFSFLSFIFQAHLLY